MSFRGGQHGRGRGRGKNRQSPYNKDRGNAWRDRGGNSRGRDEGPQHGEYLLPPPQPQLNPEEGMGEVAQLEQAAGEKPAMPLGPKKFTNKARLFFGNLPRDFTEEELQKMLTAHGEVHEIYHNKEKNFAFARMVSSWLYLVTMTSFVLYLTFPCAGVPL